MSAKADPATSASSIPTRSRVEQGGHDVPDDKIASRFPRTLENLRKALEFVDHAFVFDNSSADEPYRFVAELRGGHVERRGDTAPGWWRTLAT